MIYFTFKQRFMNRGSADSVDLMSAGNAFQHLGAATTNADSAYTVAVIGWWSIIVEPTRRGR